MIRKAAFQTIREDGRVECLLCPHACRLRDGHDGRCRVRGARNGELQTLCYGVVSSANMDPVEKKPLYHFHPGKQIFSIGGWGCNLGCVFCQNWTISQSGCKGGSELDPSRIVEIAASNHSFGIAYTYNEPIVSVEYVSDCARLARGAGLANVLVTNGYVSERASGALLENVDALNIDIKSMDESFYKSYCKGSLAPVLKFASGAVQAGRHVEITNLVIPGLNDGMPGLRKLAVWIREELGPLTPLHLSAYRPEYKLDAPATPPSTLVSAFEVCREFLSYVYLGNVVTAEGRNTFCPGCGYLLVERHGYRTTVRGMEKGKCSRCGRAADVITA